MSRRLRNVIIVLFILGSALAVAGGALLRYVSDKLHTTPTQLALQKPFGGKDLVTVLALGEDETFSKNKDVRGRTDTIIVAAIDIKNKRVNAISVPRDTRVVIPGKTSHYKINAAYNMGGIQLTAQTVADLLMIPIDYYVKTNIGGLKKTVDLVGGVGIDVEKDMHYTDRRGGLFIDLKKGYRHLDGDKALQYVRFRHDRMGDIWRVERQQKFLRALARQMTEPGNWSKLPQIIDELMTNVETNMTGKELLTLARLAKDVPQEQVRTVTLPGVPGEKGGVSYFMADEKGVQPLVDEMLRFQPPKPNVAVLNGSGVSGAAERLAEQLREAGYPVVRTGNAKRMDFSQSLVLASDPTDNQARAIGDLLNCQLQTISPEQEALRGVDPKASVVVIVGQNYL